MTITQNSVDWAAATSEATDILSQYVRIDSSHPRGRTVDTAAQAPRPIMIGRARRSMLRLGSTRMRVLH